MQPTANLQATVFDARGLLRLQCFLVQGVGPFRVLWFKMLNVVVSVFEGRRSLAPHTPDPRKELTDLYDPEYDISTPVICSRSEETLDPKPKTKP